MSIIQVTDDTIDTELVSDVPVIVDIWASWCGPCKSLGAVLEDLSEKYDGAVKVLKIDAMANKKTVDKFKVSSIPFLIVYKNGKVERTITGFHGADKVEELFEELAKG